MGEFILPNFTGIMRRFLKNHTIQLQSELSKKLGECNSHCACDGSGNNLVAVDQSDRIGIIVSLLCLFHCAAPAICASFLPALIEVNGLLAKESAEALVHFFLAPLVIFTALVSAKAIHRKCAEHCLCKLAFITGAALIFLTVVLECLGIADNLKITVGSVILSTTTLESVLTVSAGVILVCAHLHRIFYPSNTTIPTSKYQAVNIKN